MLGAKNQISATAAFGGPRYPSSDSQPIKTIIREIYELETVMKSAEIESMCG